ncbi:IscS subfamily cysteine desulfurase [Halobacillus sp. Marseille-Q1614]|uniref:IscS subfamily cysteine desulfurase n=1 Tax=Halobacillus sp. Marseille-Q1614 TaxID=2709134 RepID=UPI00156DB09C|nr:IscS subfamily cysteine desulfurase [Halobacillus sp. Marseille-Q1614]
MIYLDHCATTPMSEESIEAYVTAARTYFGNEQSLHDEGESARQLIMHCKEELAGIIKGETEGIFFTSGGSDSNHSTILSLAYGNAQRGRHIITSPLEHPSIYQALDKLKDAGFEVDETEVHPNGQISITSLNKLIRSDTILVTICHASSETGVLQPLEEIGKILKEKDCLFHSDAVQTFAKIPIDVRGWNINALSFSSHKINGPKNTGGCYISPTVSRKSLYPDIIHQDGFKSGTVDGPGIAAFTSAAMIMHEDSFSLNKRWKEMQDWFLARLNRSHFMLIGDRHNRLPHHLALRADGLEGQWVMLACNQKSIAISSGSACKSSHSAPPKSLLAMGYTPEEAHGLFRISFGRTTTFEELQQTIKVMNELITKKTIQLSLHRA